MNHTITNGGLGRRRVRVGQFTLLVALVVGALAAQAGADVLGVVSLFDGSDTASIARNGQAQTAGMAGVSVGASSSASGSQGTGGGGGADFKYLQDVSDNGAALSGSFAGNLNIEQHVFGFSVPGVPLDYDVSNEAANAQTVQVTEADKANPRHRRARVEQSFDLNATVQLMRESATEGYEGLLATLDVVVEQELGNRDATLLRGRVKVIGRRNGTVAVRTGGKIRKLLHITELSNEEGDRVFKVSFDGPLDYKTRAAKVGDELTIKTTVTSSAQSTGSGTGSEVLVGQDDQNLVLSEALDNTSSQQVPEPATVALLGLGSIPFLRFTRRRQNA